MKSKPEVLVNRGDLVLIDGTMPAMLDGAADLCGLMLIKVVYKDSNGKFRKGSYLPKRITVPQTKPAAPTEVK